MKNLIRLYMEDHRWFIGITLAVFILILFLWSLIDYTSFANKMNGFLNFIAAVLGLAVVGLVIFLIAKSHFSGGKKKGGGH
jgi:hypothetical protein